ncbi:MAG: hypothetical protein MRY51_03570 [Flavobacteriaceae bacterium]|nr:hypothetical protein [Flavobacteriaceae bacterium]MCI5088129.1 hypothetical protein [Flavobacteriaceae bacterium]
MLRNIFFAIVVLSFYNLSAQDGTVSPYSYFGLGTSNPANTVENNAMGGLSIYGDSIHINLQNPASYGLLKLTTYAVGVSHRRMNLSSETQDNNTAFTAIDYLSVAMPLAPNLGMGFGVTPVSNMGYILNSSTENGEGESINNVFSGSGGLSKLYFSLGAVPLKNLSIGASIFANFGSVSKERVQSVSDVLFGTVDRRNSRMNGFNMQMAANYTPKITDKLSLYTSVVYTSALNLKSTNTQEIGSISLTNGTDLETTSLDLSALNLANSTVTIPSKTTWGIGLGENKKWLVGASYTSQAMGDFESAFLKQANVTYGDATAFRLGGYYVPDFAPFASFFKRATYRFGFKMLDTGMTINNEQITDFGTNIGVGLPMGGTFSNVNIGLELGSLGTAKAGLVKENYFSVRVGLSLNDKWFLKRKIN